MEKDSRFKTIVLNFMEAVVIACIAIVICSIIYYAFRFNFITGVISLGIIFGWLHEMVDNVL